LDFGLRHLDSSGSAKVADSQSKIQNPKSKITITLIAAMSRNRVIGRKGALPWRMPADLKRFKQRTIGHAVIMGRKTWAALQGRPLPGRSNIVITRDREFQASGATVVHSLDQALQGARQAHPDESEVFITGGEEIFRLALPIADVIDLTVVDTTIEDGDAFFPEFERDAAWRLVSDERHFADDKHAHAFSFRRYERSRDA
jgi:dihydrofolate reductase